jgi:insertion element IS1 protein InsB
MTTGRKLRWGEAVFGGEVAGLGLLKRCCYQFTRPEGHGTPEPTKRAAVSLYGHGLSFNAVARLLGTTAPSVLRWVCGYVDRHCAKPPSGEAVVIELDEMWHFLHRKANKVWIGKAYDRATGRLVDWECGDRNEQTFQHLFHRLARWKLRLFCSDNDGVYPQVRPVGRHDQGKGQTVALERNNGQQRHWTAALRRRSIVISKSLAMPRVSIGWPARPDSGGLPPRKGLSVGSLCSLICTSTRIPLLKCTGCRSKLVTAQHMPKMQH